MRSSPFFLLFLPSRPHTSSSDKIADGRHDLFKHHLFNHYIMLPPDILITDKLPSALADIIKTYAPDRCFVLTDENTRELCLPLLAECTPLADAFHITIPAGEMNKSLETLASVWMSLSDKGATRHSLLVCLGGGVVTDLGGFAAATFKRGMAFINLPTTLLGMVDASIGGKTGIDFNGLKNEVGVFARALKTIIHPPFLQTLSETLFLDGYAEMLKHGLLSDEASWAELLNMDDSTELLKRMDGLLARSLQTKADIVARDPHERSLRKVLNLGHTIGHGIETLDPPRLSLSHGHAVAHGLVGTLWLSTVKEGFPIARMRQTVTFIREHYGRPALVCDDYDPLFTLLKHDKKNVGDDIRMVLLSDIGQPKIDVVVEKELLFEAFDFIREG